MSCSLSPSLLMILIRLKSFSLVVQTFLLKGIVDRRFLLDPLLGWPDDYSCKTKWIWNFMAASICGNTSNDFMIINITIVFGRFFHGSLYTSLKCHNAWSGLQDGHPPLGWHDTIAYLVLPVLLVVSQYVSMEIMKPPQVNTNSAIKDLLSSLFLFCFSPNT